MFFVHMVDRRCFPAVREQSPQRAAALEPTLALHCRGAAPGQQPHRVAAGRVRGVHAPGGALCSMHPCAHGFRSQVSVCLSHIISTSRLRVCSSVAIGFILVR